MTDPSEQLTCSFRDTGERETEKLIHGSRVYIRARCVELCSDIRRTRPEEGVTV